MPQIIGMEGTMNTNEMAKAAAAVEAARKAAERALRAILALQVGGGR